MIRQKLVAVDEANAIAAADGQFAGQAVFQLTGTWVGTVVFEGTLNGADWVAVQATKLSDGTTVTSTTAVGLFRVDAAGLNQVRARCSAFTSGTIVVDANPVIG